MKNKGNAKNANSNLLANIAAASNGKVVIASAKPAVQSNWGHYVSMFPCSETEETARAAIETLSLDRTNIFGVCIHHTDTETGDKARATLKKKNYSTHFIIEKNGDTTVELPLDKRAAACVGLNKWMWQIDVVGRLHINEPTGPQLLALENLIKLLSCGRSITNIDSKFASKCRKLDSTDVQKETSKNFTATYEKYHDRAVKRKSWAGVLDKLPFIVTFHGEVRPTACCGKNLINKLPDIIANLRGTSTKGDGHE